MKFTPLNINTEYSFHESAIKIDDLIQFAKDNNLDSLVITDRNSMFGVAEFVAKAKKNNIKPIVGLDLDLGKYRFTLLAKNYDGYKILCHLSTKKMKNKEIKLSEINSPYLFIIDHPTQGYFAQEDKLLEYENFYIGSTDDKHHGTVYFQEGKAFNEEQLNVLELITKMNNIEIDMKSIKTININPDEHMSCVQQAIKIASMCNVEFETDKSIMPRFKTPDGTNSKKYIKEIINKNASKLLKEKDVQVYKDRIKREMKIIEELGYEDYFLIIWDLIKWAKERDILIGPGRGSAAGSLISYLLNITEVDPIEYGLLFERFLNPERISMPDIDIDIQDNRRNEVVNYLFDKYGSDNVSLISTFSKLGAKSALRDVARYLEIPVRDVNSITKLISSEMSLEQSYKEISRFRAIIDSSSEYTKLYKLSSKIEGLPRQFSTHAAGVIISEKPIVDKAPTISGADGFNQVQYSMDYLENHNLLKIDLLGLRNLTILKKIQDEIYINHNKRVDLLKIPLNDKKTNELLSSGDTNGIFQLESYGMRKTLSSVGVSSLDDIVAILSLYRPGPMDNIPLYADIKNGKKKMELVSKEIDRITEATYGIIIYQEQIMQIAQDFSGMSYGKADILRRAIGKKKMSLIDSMKSQFIDGAVNKGATRELSERVFNLIEKFANYGFNKSHAVAYSVLSYRMAYLKARFKFEFYTALLDSSVSSQATTMKYVSEAKSKGIIVKSPNVNSSNFNVVNNKSEIILPLQIIKGFGDSAAEKLLNERNKGKFEDFFDFVSRVKNAGIGESSLILLIESNSLSDFGNVQTLTDSLPSALRYANMITYVEEGQNKIDPSIVSKPKLIVQKRDIESEIFNEKKLFGFQINAFITGEYEKEDKIIDIKSGETKEVVFLVERIRKSKSKAGSEYARVTISDSTTSCEILAFGKVYKFIADAKESVIVSGKIEMTYKNGESTYILRDYWKEVKNV